MKRLATPKRNEAASRPRHKGQETDEESNRLHAETDQPRLGRLVLEYPRRNRLVRLPSPDPDGERITDARGRVDKEKPRHRIHAGEVDAIAGTEGAERPLRRRNHQAHATRTSIRNDRRRWSRERKRRYLEEEHERTQRRNRPSNNQPAE